MQGVFEQGTVVSERVEQHLEVYHFALGWVGHEGRDKAGEVSHIDAA